MQVTGFQLREAIRRWQLRRDTLIGLLNDSLYAFEGEEKQTPDEVAAELLTAEQAIVTLQAGQCTYNIHTVFEDKLLGRMSLYVAVRLLGGAGRLEKLWRTAAAPKHDRYSDNVVRIRSVGEIRAKDALSSKELADRATKAANYAGALRAAIATVNATKQEIDLNPGLFE